MPSVPSGWRLQSQRPRSIGRVLSRLAQRLWLLVLALWLPCTMHCSLEAAGVSLFDCCTRSEANQNPRSSHSSDPCRDCHTCSAVESGGYIKQDQSVSAKPLLAVSWLLVRLEFVISAPATDGSSLRAIPPPELPPPWRFAERAALPPRAPSAVS